MSAPSPLAMILAACAALACSAGNAANGLQPPADTALWPSLTARITIQTAAVSPLSMNGLTDPGPTLRGGALMGDVVFAQPSFGSFRATSGLLFGTAGGAPVVAGSYLGPGTRLGIAVHPGPARGLWAPPDTWQAGAYLGVGFSSPLGNSSFSLSADLGWMAESTATGAGRSPLGLQGSERLRRELRLSPLLQFGMRYTF